MNFSRVGDNTVRCLLTAEDLEEQGLELEDFFHNNDNARRFLQTIVERAQEEVGYEFSGGALAMQLMPLPENELLITFSEKSDSMVRDFSEFLKNILGAMQTASEENGQSDGNVTESVESILKNLMAKKIAGDMLEDAKKKIVKEQEDERETSVPEVVICRFESLQLLEDFCAGAEFSESMRSDAYCLQETDQWFLVIHRRDTDGRLFRRFSSRVIEYGMLLPASDIQLSFLKEHGICIARNDALTVLKKCVTV